MDLSNVWLAGLPLGISSCIYAHFVIVTYLDTPLEGSNIYMLDFVIDKEEKKKRQQ